MENDSRLPQTKYQNAAFDYSKPGDSPASYTGDFSFGESTDRRFAYFRQASLRQNAAVEPHTPQHELTRSGSSIDIPPGSYFTDYRFSNSKETGDRISAFSFVSLILGGLRSGNKQMRRLFVLISLNVAYSTAELFIGLFSGRIGLVSDAFHLTFGCGLLSFSLFAMAASRQNPDRAYSYGYKRLEVLSAFTNALFLLFLSFSLAVEALHAFIQDESEHKHYLVISAIANLLVNLIGVWFFRNYARINIAYRKAEDMNYHSVCLHVLADSIRSAGLILASWLLSLGVANAEVLCLGLVSVAVFMLVMPLFKATGGILLQMAPPSIPSSALSKCWRQVSSREDIAEVSQARFWELVPGHVVGSISLQVKEGTDDRPILQFVHGMYHELGVQDLTVQSDLA
ncbi:Cation efflux family protein [Perilla frutescens var. hirtella]|uniref:Cation efflux family protein n=1 Tax=Perilla frutescens var. hirtella TaxID=608512 RepID=A0AAD4J5M9_PERFH|nr:Cation efflux family protein [Perilla frutescens var. hirtella]